MSRTTLFLSCIVLVSICVTVTADDAVTPIVLHNFDDLKTPIPAVPASPDSTCSKYSDCTNCTEHKTWLGHCRWCPLDTKCHDAGSFSNPCPAAYNIKSPDQCNMNITTHYDETTATNSLYFAAAAYAGNPQLCFNNLNLNYTVLNTSNVLCDWANDTCQVYVAVNTIEKNIVVGVRGTVGDFQLIVEALSLLKQPNVTYPAGSKGQVQEYFYQTFMDLFQGIAPTISSAVQEYPGYSVLVTGHSLGGAIASLISTELAATGIVPNPSLYTFGQPRVGNYYYGAAHDTLVKNSWRLIHHRDIVPHIPKCDKLLGICIGYTNLPYHHGVEVFSGKGSPAPPSSYRECLGIPHSEDLTCSNGKISIEPCIDIWDCIKDHTHYFDIDVAKYGRANCVASN